MFLGVAPLGFEDMGDQLSADDRAMNTCGTGSKRSGHGVVWLGDSPHPSSYPVSNARTLQSLSWRHLPRPAAGVSWTATARHTQLRSCMVTFLALLPTFSSIKCCVPQIRDRTLGFAVPRAY